MFDHILVVCTGNICRSPVAAALLQRALPEKHVDSAGTHVEAANLTGRDMDNTAREVAYIEGLACPTHAAKQASRSLVNQSDLILVMEQQHKEWLSNRYPDSRGKTMLLGEWLNSDNEQNLRLGLGKGKDIADPYQKSIECHEQVYRDLARAVSHWQSKLA
ncbi:low molecular weight protein-tyrosine-phosphatase [Idiomarina sp. UBA3162]|uniref:low molecular weight protein-tyrosine-phosphatase n=1 Tax=Idiomarina sp. UBA3162 TaxID=1946641 RepID=UPI000C8937C0|nr:low molecular weight protein-tyrosine-phosphatase [Idiomarina sp. UBA3162]MAD54273.1 phosphotyrosine protein phosphatase [Idiomarinaceae bacterium]|tara:strand:- start:2736 stop:3218 length:483 start_codon:yes stop_codon:yes gene_type:complete